MSDFRVRLLIVDDEQAIRTLCRRIAESIGFKCAEADSAEEALSYLEAEAPALVLADLKLPDMSGLDLLREIKVLMPRTEVAIMTGQSTVDSAAKATRLGAYDYVRKPFRVDELKLILQRMEEKVRLVEENEYLRDRVKNDEELNEIAGSSTTIQDVLRKIARLKDTRTPVLISGENGTGKKLVARAIHFRGPFANRPFVAVDCGALVPTLVESELFGHEKGVFSGTKKAKQGLFRAAAGGTLFLDEIGELSLEMQGKLLRAVQEKEIRPVGSSHAYKIDVRIIAASKRDLEADSQTGIFRKDLYSQLKAASIHMRPLRDRRSDIPALVFSLAARYSGNQRVQVTSAAMYCLKEYGWPGNVRELESCIRQVLAMATHKHLIDLPDLPPPIRALSGSPQSSSFEDSQLATTDLEDIERVTIQHVFKQVRGNKTLAGKMLGISRATLYRKLKRYGIGNTETSEAAGGT